MVHFPYLLHVRKVHFPIFGYSKNASEGTTLFSKNIT